MRGVVSGVVLSMLMMPSMGMAGVPYEECFNQAASRYQVDPFLLRAIARVESQFNPHAVGKNKGSEDIGIMQINSSWLPKLSRHGISREHLFEPCLNIHIGAWVLSNNIASMGATWKAVGAYNAKSEHKRHAYVGKVWAAYQLESRHAGAAFPQSISPSLRSF
jgi:soluble lytic murein transglycosylase-like protein